MKKVLKSTLDELIRAYKEFNTLRAVEVWNKRETKKALCLLWNCFCDIADDLEVQSGIDKFLFEYLAKEIVKSELTNDTLYTIIEQLGVEIVEEKWWFEGIINLNERTGWYKITNGNRVHSIFDGEDITVKFKKYGWATSMFCYNKRGRGELRGWEGLKLEGLPARVCLQGYAECLSEEVAE